MFCQWRRVDDAHSNSDAHSHSHSHSHRASTCSPTWAGYTAYTVGGTQDFVGSISKFQSGGGKFVVSFGGAVNNELAWVCTDPAALLSAYTKVVDRYNVDRIDFDIEGSDVSDPSANARRGITPMIGLNDTGEVFSLTDTTKVGKFAKANALNYLAGGK